MAFLPELLTWSRRRGFPFFFSTEATINLADDPALLSLMEALDFRYVFVGIEDARQGSLDPYPEKGEYASPYRGQCPPSSWPRYGCDCRFHPRIRRRDPECCGGHCGVRGGRRDPDGDGRAAHGAAEYATDAPARPGRKAARWLCCPATRRRRSGHDGPELHPDATASGNPRRLRLAPDAPVLSDALPRPRGGSRLSAQTAPKTGRIIPRTLDRSHRTRCGELAARVQTGNGLVILAHRARRAHDAARQRRSGRSSHGTLPSFPPANPICTQPARAIDRARHGGPRRATPQEGGWSTRLILRLAFPRLSQFVVEIRGRQHAAM